MYYVIFTDAEIYHNYTLFGPFKDHLEAEDWAAEAVIRWEGSCNVIEAIKPS